jgi:hypothetical protein
LAKSLAACVLVLSAALAPPARADDAFGRLVLHGPLRPEVEQKVRTFVSDLAGDFGGFYPDAQFRHVRAVYFASGAIIVCGELNRPAQDGSRTGWRYFSNSGPLIFESDRLETLCDQRAYAQPAWADDHEYGAEFTQAAMR